MGTDIQGGRQCLSKGIEVGKFRAGMGNVLLWLEQRASEIWNLRLDKQVNFMCHFG